MIFYLEKMDFKKIIKFEKNYKITKCLYQQQCLAYQTWYNVWMLFEQNLSTEMLKKNTNKGENYKKKIENIKFKFYD